MFDHPPRVVLSKGQVLDAQLRRSGLTKDDLFGLLRQQGVLEIKEVYRVIFEQRGKISAIRQADLKDPHPELLRHLT